MALINYFLWNIRIHILEYMQYTFMQYTFITYPNYGYKIVVWMLKERVVVTGAELRLKQTNKQKKKNLSNLLLSLNFANITK